MSKDTTGNAGSETPCQECGMPVSPAEYHPYAACLMFKACHNSDTVRGNLRDIIDYGPYSPPDTTEAPE